MAVNRVILMTDGDFNVGIADPEKLEDFVAEKRKTGVYLSVYGFGRGNYNDVMMQTLAQTGNGTAAYIDTLDEARKLFRDDFSGSLFPIADDVKIQVEFNPGRGRRVPPDRLRDPAAQPRGLQQRPGRRRRGRRGRLGDGALRDHAGRRAARRADPLRYQKVDETAGRGTGDELAFLKVRYKLPGQAHLHADRAADRPRPTGGAALDEAPEATRWALAVAAFGQKLRGDPWVGAGLRLGRDPGARQGRPGRGPVRPPRRVRAPDPRRGGRQAGQRVSAKTASTFICWAVAAAAAFFVPERP